MELLVFCSPYRWAWALTWSLWLALGFSWQCTRTPPQCCTWAGLRWEWWEPPLQRYLQDKHDNLKSASVCFSLLMLLASQVASGPRWNVMCDVEKNVGVGLSGNEVQVHWLTLHKGQDLLILLFGLTLLHQVDFVLQDEDVLELHDLDGCQVLRCLGLRTRLVTRCQEKQMLSFRDTYYMMWGFQFCLCRLCPIQDWPIRRRAASMTAAPFNMVAIRMSWPGQSTKDTCLKHITGKKNT